MSRWILVVAVLAIVVVVATVTLDPGPRTWTVQPGETLKLSPDEVHPDDRYRCVGTFLNSTPERGHSVTGGGFDVATAEDGSVTARCAPLSGL